MTDCFGNRNFMWPMKRLLMLSFFLLGFFGDGGSWGFFCFFGPFPRCSHYVTIKFSRCSYQVPTMFLKMFPITLHFYPLLFGCGSTFMHITCKRGQNRSILDLNHKQLEGTKVKINLTHVIFGTTNAM